MNLATRSGGDGTTVTFGSAPVNTSLGSYNFSTSDPVMTAGWLEFENAPRGAGGASNPSTYQDITVTFSRAVRNLTFDIADIDTSGQGNGGNRTYNYWDAIAVHGTSTPYSASLGSALTGSGTIADPWRQETFANTPPDSNAAASQRLNFWFTGAVTTFKFRYWSIQGRNSYTGTQAVWIGNMSYKVNCD
ncbi:hypothetical protein EUA93_10045 [Nocardioides oleivorans]|uniref:Uncharacterized protein n=1 Tax=Nocardioides oleivorans TaxID=273676 RepID=A0A4V1RL60_9ACTN|nr:hypothetical protein [Nocardioides oleivorans]RYB94652.1 hypothetical protein EUA93_10045 [Nocardioides oleivorans]